MGGVGGRERKCVSTLTPDELASTRVEIRERVDTASEMCREPETGDGRRATGDGRRATGGGNRRSERQQSTTVADTYDGKLCNDVNQDDRTLSKE